MVNSYNVVTIIIFTLLIKKCVPLVENEIYAPESHLSFENLLVVFIKSVNY